MEKICLVEAGNYFIGIDSGNIESIIPIREFSLDQQKLLNVEAFFEQKKCKLAKDGIILHMTTMSGIPDMAVEQMVVELDYPAQLEPLPGLYSKSAALCCPGIFIYEGQPVMLLDIDGFAGSLDQLGGDYALVQLEELENLQGENESEKVTDEPDAVQESMEHGLYAPPPVISTEEVTREAKQGAGAEQSSLDDQTHFTEHDNNISDDFSPGQLGASPAEGIDQANDEQKEVAHHEDDSVENLPLRNELSEDELARVVCWTIQTFLQLDSPAAVRDDAANVPDDLVSGVDREIVDETVARTLKKCRASSTKLLTAVMQRMKNPSTAA